MGRDSVRGIVVDEHDHVLLLKWSHATEPLTFWLAPGGGVEPGEDDATALARELAEETSLTTFEPGPHVATLHWSHGDDHRFYLVRCAHFDAGPGEGQPGYEVFDEYRWWSAEELDDARPMLPAPELVNLLRALMRGEVPDAPAEWFAS